MNAAVHYFFDVPVYRLKEDRYYTEMGDYVENTLFPPGSHDVEVLREMDRRNPEDNAGVRSILARGYGGQWRFNEIVGYIRMHFLGTQIRGEWHSVKKKRIVRTRTKLIEYRHWKLAPEVEVQDEATSEEIFQLVLEYVEDCRKEVKGRFVDTELLQVLGPHIDWRALYDAQPHVRPERPTASPLGSRRASRAGARST